MAAAVAHTTARELSQAEFTPAPGWAADVGDAGEAGKAGEARWNDETDRIACESIASMVRPTKLLSPSQHELSMRTTSARTSPLSPAIWGEEAGWVEGVRREVNVK